VGTDDATLMGTAGYAAGLVGQSFVFAGTAWVEMAEAGTGDFNTAPFTLEFWMRPHTVTTGSDAYLAGKSYPDGGRGWDIRQDNARLRVVGVNGWTFNITSANLLEVDVWQHVALVRNDTTALLYLDGEVVGSSPSSMVGTSSSPFRLGFTSGFGGTAFLGQMDEIAIFDRALGPLEVLAIYRAGAAGKCGAVVPSSTTTTTTLSTTTSSTTSSTTYTTTSTSTTTTHTLPPPICGDANEDDNLNATDALLILRVSVALDECLDCICDINGSGAVTASDALIALRASVGLPEQFQCPAC
jgi:hypothetical protein